MNRGLGYIRDRHKLASESPDWRFEARFKEAPPPSASTREFVIDVLDQGRIGSCHDASTEVLTDSGWKLFAELNGSERLATVNPATSELTYETPTRLVRFPFKGELVVAANKSLNFRVTPDHKMLVRQWNERERTLSDGYELVEAKDLGWYVGLMNRVDWRGETRSDTYTLPGVDHKHVPQRSPRDVPMAAWLRFLGIYLAEGTMLKRHVAPSPALPNGKERYAIQIAACKERERAFVAQVLADIGVRALVFADRFVFNSRQVYEAMASLGLEGVKAGDKFVPHFVFKQSAAMIREFFAGHFAGDGSSSQGFRAHYTSSNRLADDLQRLAFLSGVESRISVRAARSSVTADGRTIVGRLPEYRVSICERKNLSIERKRMIHREPYDGEVFCAEVPTHHTLVTRREGKILISGNCVANAILQVLRMGHVRQGVAQPELGSRLMAYYLGRAVQHRTHDDSGTQLRLVFQTLNMFGFCPESVWPYSDMEYGARLVQGAWQFDANLDKSFAPFRRMPSGEAMSRSFDQRSPTEYHRVYETGYARIEAVKHAIAQGLPVAFGTLVSESFCENRLGTRPLDPPVGQVIAGGHAMVIVGYDGDAFEILNSWGTGFGDGGYCQFSADYVAWDETSDLWTAQHVPVEGEL